VYIYPIEKKHTYKSIERSHSFNLTFIFNTDTHTHTHMHLSALCSMVSHGACLFERHLNQSSVLGLRLQQQPMQQPMRDLHYGDGLILPCLARDMRAYLARKTPFDNSVFEAIISISKTLLQFTFIITSSRNHWSEAYPYRQVRL
jgi:hypothetical protein